MAFLGKKVKMTTTYQERWERILTAVSLGRPDRVPIVLEYAGFAARVTGTSMATFLSSRAGSIKTMIEAWHLVNRPFEADAINYGSFDPYSLCFLFGSKVRVAGVDLSESDDWQVDEKELMVPEDYDRILKEGWPSWWKWFLNHRVFDDVPCERNPLKQPGIDVRSAWAEQGIPVLTGGTVSPPFEILCGARSLNFFVFDLLERGDQLEWVMEEMVPHLAPPMIESARNSDLPVVWVGGWRAAPAMLSPEMFNRFAWPPLRRIVNEIVDAGLIALLHLDSNWTRELERFREFPRGRCILAFDGFTDISKAKEVIGDHLCIMGDVPATKLAFGEPEEVYDYCRRLVKMLGPEGFILQSGCDIPNNARLENVRAMVAAATS